MRVSKLLVVVCCLFFLHSCKRTLTDEEMRDRIVGNWESVLLVQGSLNFTPKTDSTLFYTEGRKNFITFTKRNTVSKTGEKPDGSSYLIEDGFLLSWPKEGADTLEQEIIFLNSKKLVLFEEKEDKKYYYSRFVY